LEKLVDPDAVPDELFGEMLALVFRAFEALMRENPSAADPDFASSSRKAVIQEKESKDA
jgi:hypothetical protein